ncbi:MAG: MBL fold metallo-hydrolase [Candidatus Dojkabacteria bacterium]
MTEYHVLVEGYAHEGENGNFLASPTSVLLLSNGKKILMDPGADRQKLLESLNKLNLKTEDIDLIFLTHYHPDHFLNIRLFPNIEIVDAETIWRDNAEEIASNCKIEGTNIEVIKTPGHSPEHSSLIINANEGKLCFSQDVFWWQDGEQKTDDYEAMVNYADPFASDMNALKESRKKLLEIADWIIPGHGKKFKNNFKNS